MKKPLLLDLLSTGLLVTAIPAIWRRRVEPFATRGAVTMPENQEGSTSTFKDAKLDEVRNLLDRVVFKVQELDRRETCMFAAAREASFGAFKAFKCLWYLNSHCRRATVYTMVLLIIVTMTDNMSTWLETSWFHMSTTPLSLHSLVVDFAYAVCGCGVVVTLHGMAELMVGLTSSSRETIGPMYRKASQVTLSAGAALIAIPTLYLFS